MPDFTPSSAPMMSSDQENGEPEETNGIIGPDNANGLLLADSELEVEEGL